jgi:itaconate CoA-transferase
MTPLPDARANDRPTAAVPGPLAGIVVVSFEQAVAAPFTTRQLADLGARVIKVERRDGGDFARSYDRTVLGLSSYFVWLNRSKESITLDLKAPGAHDVLGRLVDAADVVVQNLAPTTAARLGITARELTHRRDRLIACDISGYGATGPFADRKAYDLLVQCETGVTSITGTEDVPSRVGISIADIAAGMYAFSGVLAALYERATTGKGQAFEVSLFDALAEWMGQPMYYAAYGGHSPRRCGAAHSTIAPYGPYRTRDGDAIVVSVQNEREWMSFCRDVLGDPALHRDPGFATNSDRVQHTRALDDIIERVTAALGSKELVGRLEKANIAYGTINDVHAFMNHPQLSARDRWRSVGSPVGALRALLPPVTVAGREVAMGSIPALSEHTPAVLRWLGYDESQISDLRTQEII